MDGLHSPPAVQYLHNRDANALTQAARADRVTTYWRVVGPSSRPLICALYRTTTGLRVRIGYEPGGLLRVQPVASEEAGAAVAASWKKATMAVDGFLDLDPPA